MIVGPSGNVIVTFGANIGPFRRGYMSVMRDMQRAESSVTRTMSQVGTVLSLGVTAPMMAMGRAALSTFTTFDREMRNVASISDEIAANFGEVFEVVRDFGSDTARGPVQAAEALYEITSAGIIEQAAALDMMKHSTNLAEAGLSDMKQTAKALAVTMNALTGVEISAEEVSDIWLRTVQLGVGELEEFVGAQKYIIPALATFGNKFEEGMALWARYTQMGAEPHSAARGISRMLVNLLKPSEAMQEILDRIATGISFREIVDETGSLLTALEKVRNVMETDEELWQMSIVGARPFVGLTNDMDATREAIEEFSMGVVGATDRALDQQSQAFSYKLGRMGSEIAAFGIKVGDVLQDTMQPLVEEVTRVFDILGNAPEDAIRNFLTFMGTIAAVGPLLLFGAGVSALAGYFKKLVILPAVNSLKAFGRGLAHVTQAQRGFIAAYAGTGNVFQRTRNVMRAATLGTRIFVAEKGRAKAALLSLTYPLRATARGLRSLGSALFSAGNRVRAFKGLLIGVGNALLMNIDVIAEPLGEAVKNLFGWTTVEEDAKEAADSALDVWARHFDPDAKVLTITDEMLTVQMSPTASNFTYTTDEAGLSTWDIFFTKFDEQTRQKFREMAAKHGQFADSSYPGFNYFMRLVADQLGIGDMEELQSLPEGLELEFDFAVEPSVDVDLSTIEAQGKELWGNIVTALFAGQHIEFDDKLYTLSDDVTSQFAGWDLMDQLMAEDMGVGKGGMARPTKTLAGIIEENIADLVERGILVGAPAGFELGMEQARNQLEMDYADVLEQEQTEQQQLLGGAIGTIVGGLVGVLAGGPAGALIGSMVGQTIGTYLWPILIKFFDFEDLKLRLNIFAQGAKYTIMRAFGAIDDALEFHDFGWADTRDTYAASFVDAMLDAYNYIGAPFEGMDFMQWAEYESDRHGIPMDVFLENPKAGEQLVKEAAEQAEEGDTLWDIINNALDELPNFEVDMSFGMGAVTMEGLAPEEAQKIIDEVEAKWGELTDEQRKALLNFLVNPSPATYAEMVNAGGLLADTAVGAVALPRVVTLDITPVVSEEDKTTAEETGEELRKAAIGAMEKSFDVNFNLAKYVIRFDESTADPSDDLKNKVDTNVDAVAQYFRDRGKEAGSAYVYGLYLGLGGVPGGDVAGELAQNQVSDYFQFDEDYPSSGMLADDMARMGQDTVVGFLSGVASETGNANLARLVTAFQDNPQFLAELTTRGEEIARVYMTATGLEAITVDGRIYNSEEMIANAERAGDELGSVYWDNFLGRLLGGVPMGEEPYTPYGFDVVFKEEEQEYQLMSGQMAKRTRLVRRTLEEQQAYAEKMGIRPGQMRAFVGHHEVFPDHWIWGLLGLSEVKGMDITSKLLENATLRPLTSEDVQNLFSADAAMQNAGSLGAANAFKKWMIDQLVADIGAELDPAEAATLDISSIYEAMYGDQAYLDLVNFAKASKEARIEFERFKQSLKSEKSAEYILEAMYGSEAEDAARTLAEIQASHEEIARLRGLSVTRMEDRDIFEAMYGTATEEALRLKNTLKEAQEEYLRLQRIGLVREEDKSIFEAMYGGESWEHFLEAGRAAEALTKLLRGDQRTDQISIVEAMYGDEDYQKFIKRTQALREARIEAQRLKAFLKGDSDTQSIYEAMYGEGAEDILRHQQAMESFNNLNVEFRRLQGFLASQQDSESIFEAMYGTATEDAKAFENQMNASRIAYLRLRQMGRSSWDHESILEAMYGTSAEEAAQFEASMKSAAEEYARLQSIGRTQQEDRFIFDAMYGGESSWFKIVTQEANELLLLLEELQRTDDQESILEAMYGSEEYRNLEKQRTSLIEARKETERVAAALKSMEERHGVVADAMFGAYETHQFEELEQSSKDARLELLKWSALFPVGDDHPVHSADQKFLIEAATQVMRHHSGVWGGIRAEFKTGGKEGGAGFAEGLDESVAEGGVTDTASKNFVSTILSTLGNELQMKSPSQKAAELGMYFSQGFGLGLTENKEALKTSVLDWASVLNIIPQSLAINTQVGSTKAYNWGVYLGAGLANGLLAMKPVLDRTVDRMLLSINRLKVGLGLGDLPSGEDFYLPAVAGGGPDEINPAHYLLPEDHDPKVVVVNNYGSSAYELIKVFNDAARRLDK